MSNNQIYYLNNAAKERTGFSFLSLLQTADERLLDVTHDALELYALACLEKAADNAKVEIWNEGIADIQKAIDTVEGYIEIHKESITSKENLV